MTGNDWATLIISGTSLVVSLVALVVALVAMGRSDRNASGATLVTLYESFRQGWVRFQAETDPERSRYEMAELMNTFEIACAIHQDNSIHGRPRDILEEYLCDTFTKFADDVEAVKAIRSMIDGPSTFKYLRMFQQEMSRSGRIKADPLLILGFRTQ